MNKQFLLVIGLFLIALGSGVVVGMNLKRTPAEPPQDRAAWHDTLQLTPEQREKMKAIWSEVGRGGPRGGERRREIYQQRDKEIAALIPSERKAEYDALMARAEEEIAEMNRKQQATFQKAVEQTKAILSPEQQKKYDEMMARWPMGGRGRAGSRPSTQAAR